MRLMNVEFMTMVISEREEREHDWRRDIDVSILFPIFTIMFKIFHHKKEKFGEEAGDF